MNNETNTMRKSNSAKRPNGRKPRSLGWLLYLLLFGICMLMFYPTNKDKEQKSLSYTQFTAYVENDHIAKLTVYDDNKVKALVKSESYPMIFGSMDAGKDKNGEITVLVPSVEEFGKYIGTVNENRKQANLSPIDVTYEKSHDYWILILSNVLPFILLILFFVWMGRGVGSAAGGIFGVGKARAQLFDKEKKDKVTFKDYVREKLGDGYTA